MHNIIMEMQKQPKKKHVKLPFIVYMWSRNPGRGLYSGVSQNIIEYLNKFGKY